MDRYVIYRIRKILYRPAINLIRSYLESEIDKTNFDRTKSRVIDAILALEENDLG